MADKPLRGGARTMASAGRMRQPKAQPVPESAKTRERILDAAKRIYRERNFSSVRTVDITDASGANIALVNYYFGGKNQLFLQVFAEACEVVAKERAQGLDELLSRDPAPSTAALVQAWMAPVFAQTRSAEARMLCSHLLGLVLASDVNEGIREVFGDSLARVDARYAEQFARARPDLTEEAIAWRMLSAIGAYSLVLGHPGLIALTQGSPGSRDASSPVVQEELLHWLVAAMDAPASAGLARSVG
jgi:AcrR family transcriptional regulator